VTIDPLFDETFIFSPSFLDDALTEGKAIGTSKHADLTLLQNMLKASDADPANYAKALKAGLNVGKRKLEETQSTAHGKMVSAIGLFYGGKINEAELRKRVTKTMKVAWKDAFLAGLRGSGIPGNGAGKGKVLIDLKGPQEEAWLKSAVAHEMRFLNKFLDSIVEDTGKMPLIQRVSMYVKSLRSCYESARVIALPPNVLIHWVGPHDKKSCPGCTYLFEAGTFTKFTLPTVPAAGMTPCLSNCRDRLLVRRVTPGEVAEAEEALPKSRDAMLRDLREIKSSGKSLSG